ncbi:uncharacterized protein FA14DRAFT_92245 [Meira miltonrushii]|uniref:B-related factor 1 n=1 Tax=Meira miltonrushii TaxID=1280837 RepID=A0A316V361_9BASI|nr:uncharacterized protein FA14DRAFT_92245 [Meira miltonrushii]PWN31694.1 hypothetical protein FA14DRAFT_92245 [Meira miltonrushii]
MAICPSCQSTDVEQSEAQIVCKVCGTVLEDSQIVSDVTFAENSAGGAVVQGSYVGNEQRGARTQGPGGFRSGGVGASREQTVSNARYAIRALGSAKRVPPATIEKAGRLFQLALEGGTYKADGSEPHNFVLGRKSEYTQASCLYVACRMDRTNHMLIDFADAIGVNVFVLGRSYLRLIRCLGFKMPIIDPSIYISRFASLLDFGDETQRVATDATRLVKRFNKDWITHGRRPAGICGACLLLAARMNNFRRSIAEIIQVVKIADVTLRKRLEEFKETSSSKLTIDDFRNIWLEEENEPPAFALQGLTKKGNKKGSKARPNKKLKGGDEDGEEEEEEGGNEADVEEDDEEEEEQQQPVDPRLEALADQATHAEISQYLNEDAAREMQKKEEEAVQIKSSQKELPALDDELAGLDEEELEAFILTPDEVKIKERVWVEFNRDYLEKTLERQLKMEADIKAGITPRPARRKKSKPRDSSAAPSTAAESTKQMMMRKKNFSKRLNYDKISTLFDVPTPTKAKRSHSDVEDEEEVEEEIYHNFMDQERPRANSLYPSEAETVDDEAIVEEEGDALPSNHPDVRKRSKRDLQMRDKRKRDANSAGRGEESEADGATSHGGATDAETDYDDQDNWMAGIPGYRRDSEPNAEEDYYEQEYE